MANELFHAPTCSCPHPGLPRCSRGTPGSQSVSLGGKYLEAAPLASKGDVFMFQVPGTRQARLKRHYLPTWLSLSSELLSSKTTHTPSQTQGSASVSWPLYFQSQCSGRLAAMSNISNISLPSKPAASGNFKQERRWEKERQSCWGLPSAPIPA